MSRNVRILVSTTIAAMLLMAVLVGVALADMPEAGTADAADESSVYATANVTPTTASVDPETITEFGDHPLTYTFSLHNDDETITPTARFTVTLDDRLAFEDESGTLVLPGGTLMFPEDNVIVWAPTLTYCEHVTLTLYATATVDSGSLMFPQGLPLVTAWESEVEGDYLDGELRTSLVLPRIYLPVIMRNFSF